MEHTGTAYNGSANNNLGEEEEEVFSQFAGFFFFLFLYPIFFFFIFFNLFLGATVWVVVRSLETKCFVPREGVNADCFIIRVLSSFFLPNGAFTFLLVLCMRALCLSLRYLPGVSAVVFYWFI